MSVEGKNYVDKNNSKWDSSVCKLMHRYKIGLKPKIFCYCCIPRLVSLSSLTHIYTEMQNFKKSFILCQNIDIFSVLTKDDSQNHAKGLVFTFYSQ